MSLAAKPLFIELSKSEFVNVAIIDEQHQTLGELLNELFELLGANKPETVKFLMNRLVEHLKTHFETEEKLMKDLNYINFFSHKMEHDRFLSKIVDFQEYIRDDKGKLNLELLKSCKNWFHNHIELNDRKLGVFLTENNIH